MRRILPHPRLTLLIILTWMALANAWHPGSFVFAVLMGLVIPWLTARWWPERPAIPLSRLPLAIEYAGVVLWDIVKSNIAVARIVLFLPNERLQPAWVAVPLDLTVPEAVAVLAGTVTMTPGTLSCDFTPDGRTLLVHCLHAPDPQSVCDEIKARYEARLRRIFP